jgi:RNA polymerase sigma factor (sigma-70 family)
VITPFDPRETGPAADPRAIPAVDVEAAYAAYHERLFLTVLRSTRDAEVAHDIVQEAFLELVRAGQAGRIPDNQVAWLHRVAMNRVIDWSRRRARWAGHVPCDEGVADGPEAEAISREEHRALRAALDTMPHDARRALVLEGQGFEPAEIAPIIGRTGQATRTLLCRARRRLRETLVLQPA